MLWASRTWTPGRCTGAWPSHACAIPHADPAALNIRVGAQVLLDGEDVTEAIRTPQVSEAASKIAAEPAVRAAMVVMQRSLLSSGDWVAEGRDIGTVVAPDAELKIFLTASPQERARRRSAQTGQNEAEVLAEQHQRDARDRDRADSPLVAAADAIRVDTTGLSLPEVVDRIVAQADDRRTAQTSGSAA